MSIYKPRLSAPSATDKNWIKSTRGGYNYCIEISNGSCLPNCVGYAWGRWREILGASHNLSRANAENWWTNTGDGYERGQTPRLGAVMCWRNGAVGNGNDGAGHVAIVEKISADGRTVTTSESNYGGTRFQNVVRSYPYALGRNFAFQGFIYLPIKFDSAETAKPTKTVDEVAREVIKGLWGNGSTRTANLQAAGYDPNAVQARVNAILAGNNAPVTNSKSIDTLAQEVLQGKWGNGADRAKRLTDAGYDYNAVQAKVNQLASSGPAPAPAKSIDEVAREVLNGQWGNGADRQARLSAAGYNYAQVQARVNELAAPPRKSIDEIAREVIAGKWGNGADRQNRLTAAGYNYAQVQARVNQLL